MSRVPANAGEAWDLERLLRSPLWRVLLAAGLVVGVAALNAQQLHEIAQLRRIEIGWGAIFAPIF